MVLTSDLSDDTAADGSGNRGDSARAVANASAVVAVVLSGVVRFNGISRVFVAVEPSHDLVRRLEQRVVPFEREVERTAERVDAKSQRFRVPLVAPADDIRRGDHFVIVTEVIDVRVVRVAMRRSREGEVQVAHHARH